MPVPLDEDAPALAEVAGRAVDVLRDATAPQVGYPGLHDTADVERVLAALAGLADELPDTARQVAAFLDSQLAHGHIVAADEATQDAPAAVQAAQAVLAEVQASAAGLALLLTRAEAAMLALAPPKP